jgi:hypothetical protein
MGLEEPIKKAQIGRQDLHEYSLGTGKILPVMRK